MLTRHADAVWEGSVQQGNGRMKTESGAFRGAYSFLARFQDPEPTETNPEELIAAAHAGCFSMMLAETFSRAGYEEAKVYTNAAIQLQQNGDGAQIEGIELDTDVYVPSIPDETFLDCVETAKDRCLVSQALDAINIDIQVDQIHQWEYDGQR